MADYSSGYNTAGSAIAAGITTAMQQYEERKKQDEFNRQMFDYLKTVPGAVPAETLAKWHDMNPKEKNAAILTAQFRAQQQTAQAKEQREAEKTALENRRTIAETNTAIIKTAKEAAEPVFTGPRETTTASGTKLVQVSPTSWQIQKGNEPPLNLSPEEAANYAKTHQVPLRTSDKSFVPGKLPDDTVDVDAQGNPILNPDKTLFRSGKKWMPVTAAMQKQMQSTADSKIELAQTEADLAKERARKGNIFGVGKPDVKKIDELERKRTQLMAQFGTPAAAPAQAAAPAPSPTPGPSAAPAAAPSATPAAAGAPPAAGPPATGRVTMVAPDGTVGTIPAEQVQLAIQQGYTQQ